VSRRRTLRGRVSATALLVIGTWVALIAIGFDLIALNRLDGQRDDTLRIRAQAASALVIVRGGEVIGLRESGTDARLDAGTWVYGADRLVDHPFASTRLQSVVDRVRASNGFTSRANHRFYVLPVRSGTQRVGTIVTATSDESGEEPKRTIVSGSIIVGLLIVAGAYPVLRVATARALSPVARMARQAQDWSSDAAHRRFGSSSRYEELDGLARSLDGLLDRIDAVLRHERQLSGELSHELRTPLSRLLGEIELLQQRRVGEWQAELDAMRESALTMNAIIESALAVARTQLGSRVARTALDEVLTTYATSEAPTVSVEPAGLTVGVEPAVVLRIVNALVENARRYARRSVRLSSREADGTIEVLVTNDGAAIDPGDRPMIFEPGFTRAGDDHAGAGLGLPLARRLARAADGDLWLAEPSQPTTFVLRLPRG
jgi:signal transduction histidine kinase